MPTVASGWCAPDTGSLRAEQRYLHHMFLKRLLYYLNPTTLFGKSDPNVNVRMMHGINRISILLFLACLTVMIVRACTR